MPTLNRPQAKFLALPHKFCGFVAGFGSGKTWVGCSGLAQHAWEWPRINAGYFAPTYAQIRDIFYPTMEEVAFDWGLRTRINQANHEVHLFSGSAYRTTIICRSMEKPQTIVGFKVGRSLVDELDVLSLIKAQQAWRKIIARMRYKVDGLRNRVDVTTTPEGFKFVFQQFVKQLREKPHLQDLYGLVQASTYDNEANLPDDYIDSLMDDQACFDRHYACIELVCRAGNRLQVGTTLHCGAGESFLALAGQALAQELHHVVLAGSRRGATAPLCHHILDLAGRHPPQALCEPFITTLLDHRRSPRIQRL